MNVILFGATGMVGQGVLRECLLDPGVERVLIIGRSTTGQQSEKLREVIHENFLDFSDVESQLAGYDVCFFCLGVSSAGMAQQQYSRVTYDYTMAAAQTLSRLNPNMTFIYVSGMGADSTGRGGTMWARVKGKTENALLHLPFKAAYMFRPAGIQPLHGVKSRTRLYRTFYTVLGPLLNVLRPMFPKYITTTEQVGRVMIKVAREGFRKPILETEDINSV